MRDRMLAGIMSRTRDDSSQISSWQEDARLTFHTIILVPWTSDAFPATNPQALNDDGKRNRVLHVETCLSSLRLIVYRRA